MCEDIRLSLREFILYSESQAHIRVCTYNAFSSKLYTFSKITHNYVYHINNVIV